MTISAIGESKCKYAPFFTVSHQYPVIHFPFENQQLTRPISRF